MNWLGAPAEKEPLAIRAMFKHGPKRYRRVPLGRAFGFCWGAHPPFHPIGIVPRKITVFVKRNLVGEVWSRSATLLYNTL